MNLLAGTGTDAGRRDVGENGVHRGRLRCLRGEVVRHAAAYQSHQEEASGYQQHRRDFGSGGRRVDIDSDRSAGAQIFKTDGVGCNRKGGCATSARGESVATSARDPRITRAVDGVAGVIDLEGGGAGSPVDEDFEVSR